MPKRFSADAASWRDGLTAPSSLREKIRAASAAGLAIFLTGWLASLSLSGGGLATLIASMGASAVILFAMPHSPVAKPWPVVGGHLLSAAIGILCARWIPNLWLAGALAVGLAIFAMHTGRCLHPPGGASALTAVLGGESVKALGFQFLLTPIALNLAVMLLMSTLYLRLLPKPAPPAAPAPAKPKRGIGPADLRAAMAEMGEFIDVGERELQAIYQLAGARAFRRSFGAATAADVMTADPLAVEFGTELEQAWALLREHRIKALPVIDPGRHVIGIVTQSDFFRHARAGQLRGLNAKLRDLLKPSPAVHSDKPEVVGQIMSRPALTAGGELSLPELAQLLTQRGVHQLPVVDARDKLIGIITQTDLIAALYRSMADTL